MDPLNERSDAQLVVGIARFEEGAMAEVYRRHGGVVFALARRVIGDAGAAEDVSQEVFVRLWQEPGRFDSARGSLRSFLLAQTHSRSVDLIRSHSARTGREERDARATAQGGYDLEREVWDMTLADQVARAVSALPEDEMIAVKMAYFGGCTYREVAVNLSEPEGTIKSRIRSGLRRLERMLVESGVTAP